MTATLLDQMVCPVSITTHQRVLLGHGSGGKLSAALLRERILPRFTNPHLAQLGDGAVFPMLDWGLVVTTDTFVVSPLEFPGGNIGSLAVHGTLNDLSMMGAVPQFLTAALVLEEGLDFDVLDRVLDAMAAAARAANIPIITGDTKVVERGKADGIFINTTGIGIARGDFAPAPQRARPGDAVIVSGPLGRHGVAILAARENLGFVADVTSDSAVLEPLVERLRVATAGRVHALRDPTRGGVASTLNEIAQAANVGIVLDEAALPVPGPVAAVCEMLGLDPLYVANEGVFVAMVPPELADAAVATLRAEVLGMEARIIGQVTDQHPGIVALRTGMGSTRVVDMLPGDQLPRIC